MPVSWIVVVCGLDSVLEQSQNQQELQKFFEDRFPKDNKVKIHNYIKPDTLYPGWIHNLAQELLDSLKNDIEETYADIINIATPLDRIIFFAQNVGGWVVKHALVQATNSWRYQYIPTMTRATLFFGTLHRETSNMIWEVQLTKLLMDRGLQVPDLSHFVETTSTALRTLNREFLIIAGNYFLVNVFATDLDSRVSPVLKFPFLLHRPRGIEISLHCTSSDLWTFGRDDINAEELWQTVDDLTRTNTEAIDRFYYRLLEELSRRDPGVHQLQGHHNALEAGRWILDTDTYHKWQESTNSTVLILHGKSGSGAATFASQIMQTEMDRPDATISRSRGSFISFCCNKQYIRGKSNLSLLISLSRQLLLARPSLFERARPLCKWLSEQNLFTLNSAKRLFLTLLSLHDDSPVFCFITLIHHNNYDWRHFISDILSLDHLPNAAVKLVLTTHSQLETISNLGITQPTRVLAMNIDEEPWMNDAVRSSLLARLRRRHKGALWRQKEDMIIDRLCPRPLTETSALGPSGEEQNTKPLGESEVRSLVAQTSPNLLVTTLQVSYLQGSEFRSTLSALSEQLKGLLSQPSDIINKTVNLVAVGQRPWARMAMDCVVTTVRPLKTAEFSVALAIMMNSEMSFDKLDLEFSLDIAADLTNHEKISHLFRIINDRIYPVHESLHEALLRIRGPSYDSQMNMLKICVDYIVKACTELKVEYQIEDDMTNLPMRLALGSHLNRQRYHFLNYAVLHWPDHYNQCRRIHKSTYSCQMALRLLHNKEVLPIWVALYNQQHMSVGDLIELPPSALTIACTFGLAELVELVLKTSPGELPLVDRGLTLAAEHGYLEIVKTLCDSASKHFSSTALAKALALAAAGGHTTIVDYLYSHDNKINVEYEHFGLTPLLHAVKGGHLDTMLSLVKIGACDNALTRDKQTALHFAARLGQVGIVRKLILLGADVAAIDHEGYDLLAIVSESGFQEVADIVFSKEEAIQQHIGQTLQSSLAGRVLPGLGRTCLSLAAENGHSSVIKVLLREGAGPEISDSDKSTPLRLACDRGHLRAASDLIDNLNARWRRSEVDSLDQVVVPPHFCPEMQLCLRQSTLNGHSQIVELLLRQNLDHLVVDCEGRTALHHASARGHYEIVPELIKHNFHVNAADNRQMTPLKLAAEAGWQATIEVLLENRAMVELPEKDPKPSNGEAVVGTSDNTVSDGNPSSTAIEELNQKKGSDDEGLSESLEDTSRMTALQLAVKGGHMKIARTLIDNNAAPSGLDLRLAIANCHILVIRFLLVEMLETHDRWSPSLDDILVNETLIALRTRRTSLLKELLVPRVIELFKGRPAIQDEYLLHKAAKRGYFEGAQLLLDLGFDAKECDKSRGQTPIHRASYWGRTSIVNLFLRTEPETQRELRSRDDETPLYIAVKGLEHETADVLLTAGADINAVNGASKRTALYLAAFNGYRSFVEKLLRKDADPTIATNDTCWTPLHAAFDDEDICDLILNPKPSETLDEMRTQKLLGLRTNTGSTPLILASSKGYPKVVRVLIKYESDLNAINNDGATALHQAVEYGHASAMEALLDAEADQNIKDKRGWKPLHVAAHELNPGFVEKLLPGTEDINGRTVDDETALSLAIRAAISRLDDRYPTKECTKTFSLLIAKRATLESGSEQVRSLIDKLVAVGNCDNLMLSIQSLGGENKAHLSRLQDIALISAIQRSDLPMVETLLKNGADPNYNGAESLPLVAAVQSGSMQIVGLLLGSSEANRETNMGESNDIAPVGDAETNEAKGEDKVVPIVTTRANPNPKLEGEDSIIHIAARRDMKDIVKLLIDNGTLIVQNAPGCLLNYSMEWASGDVVDYLFGLIRDHDPRIDPNGKDEFGDTALHLALSLMQSRPYRSTYRDWVSKLIDPKLRSEPNSKNYSGVTAFQQACRDDSWEFIHPLIEHPNMDLTQKDIYGRDAAYWVCLAAVDGRNLEQAFDIIAAKMKDQDDWEDRCSLALHAAVESDNKELVTKLVTEHSAKTDKVDRNEWAVQYAAWRRKANYPEIPELFSFPTVKEPLAWNAQDAHPALEIEDDGLTVKVKKRKSKSLQLADNENGYAVVRANHCMYGIGFSDEMYKDIFFEITIVERYLKESNQGKDEASRNAEQFVAIGFCTEAAPLNRMLGWDTGSWGYHSDDGQVFEGQGWGLQYGLSYGEKGDVIGCRIDFDNRCATFFKRGVNQGTVFNHVVGKLYPAVSIDVNMVGCVIRANFKPPFESLTMRSVA